MANITLRRFKNEILQLEKESDSYAPMFQLIKTENIYVWEAKIFGSKNSLYENLEFKVRIQIPVNYPLEPPYIKFITPIFHVNINPNGDICLDILKNKWSPLLSIRSLLISIINLLNEPNYDDPLNGEVYRIYKEDYEKYKNAIKDYSKSIN